jgi:hypothetical protein
MTQDEKLTEDMRMSQESGNPNAATDAVVFGRTRALTDEDLRGMDAEPSTAKCSKMKADIDAYQGDLAAAARKLKGGPPENVYGLT